MPASYPYSYMVRSYDQAGYYELQTLLMLTAAATAVWQWRVRNQRAFGVLFLSGALFQAFMEWLLLVLGLRGAGFHLTVFGVLLSGPAACLFQGLVEGGIFGVAGYWLIHLSRPAGRNATDRIAYAGLLLLVLAASVAVSLLARGQPPSSARPMFAELPIVILVLQTALLLAIIWFSGGSGFHFLGIYYLGTLIYVLAHFEPMHWLGVRYIGVQVAERTFEAVGPARQFWWMLYSHVFEVAGAKIHYFILPYVLKMVPIPRETP